MSGPSVPPSVALDPRRRRLPPGATAGTIAAAAMIAQQVAGKAARDALYLSLFEVKTLPAMMALSAVVSLVAVLWLSRMMVRHSPARVVPVAFAVSGAAFLAEWALSFRAPGIAAIALYLHTALFGAAVVSAFWSLVNETFAPHTGRSAVSRIAGGGTLGGALGGLAAWRAAGVIDVPTMLPLLALVNLACLWGVLRLRVARGVASGSPDEGLDAPVLPSLGALRRAPYLRDLALVVALGAVVSGLLDYAFSAAAVKVYPKGPELLAFFALFWLVTGALSFALQLVFGRLVLEKLGLATTTALLPAVVVVGGALGLGLPGLWSMALLRGGEAAQRNSLFRAAYEQLYTPLSEQTKRSTKTLIDVGCDRLGTVSASLIAIGILHFAPAGRAQAVVLAVAMGCALLSLARSRSLHRGYVAVLEQSLSKSAAELEPVVASPAPLAQERIDVRDEVVQHLDGLRGQDPVAFAMATGEAVPETTTSAELESGPSDHCLTSFVQPLRELSSGDVGRVGKILRAEAPLPAPLVALAVLLLADPDLHLEAIRSLRRSVLRATGQLVDALCDPSLAFDVRRRIPRVLSECPTQRAADGLFSGLDDERFEVRYACGRALLRMTPDPAITIGLDRVVGAVLREVKRARSGWESGALDDAEEDEASELFDRLLRDRIDRSMEHVFNILALHLDPPSLRTAFTALHTEDARLRGTALEYLETVLPEQVRDVVWPFLGEARPMRPARPATEILADLVQAAGAEPSSSAAIDPPTSGEAGANSPLLPGGLRTDPLQRE